MTAINPGVSREIPWRDLSGSIAESLGCAPDASL